MKKQHIIDTVFALLIFLLFTICIVSVLYAGSHVYNNIATKETEDYQQNIALHYFVEKVHQGKTKEAIQLVELDNTPALAIYQEYNEEQYVTYIYLDQQNIKELFIKITDTVTKADGNTIMNVKDLQMEKINTTCLHITVTFLNNQQKDVYLNTL